MTRRTQRGTIRRSFTKVYKELKDEMDKDEQQDEELISSLLAKLEHNVNQLSKIDDEIMKELCEQDVSEVEMEEEYETTHEYRDKWNELVPSEKFTRAMVSNQSTSASMESRTEKSRYKLPKLKLVEFSGCPRECRIRSPPCWMEVYVRDLLKVVLTNNIGQQRLPLVTLYDKLETQLRSLESLGVTSNKYAAMLYALVESSIPQDVLLVWERIRNQRIAEVVDDEDQLKQLMTFLRGEVESSIRLEMAKRSVASGDEFDDRDE